MKDAMGMDYLPVFDDEPGSPEVEGHASVTIDSAQQRLIGLRTVAVDRGPVASALRTVGRVSIDETRVRRVNVKVAGYVEHVFADFVGRPVRAGQPLFSLYSPEVLATENELLAAARTDGPGSALVASARRKLSLWDVPATELERLEREGTAARVVTFVSPISGVVTKKDLVEGARVEAGAMPFEVVDLTSVWVVADVYETDLRFVEPGMTASLSLRAFPGKTWEGGVSFIEPVLDPKSRTVRVRSSFPNPKGELKPELFGEVTLSRPAREVLRVPADAVVLNGERPLVFVARGGGRFEPRVVSLGEAGREFSEVLDGVAAGELVVTRANFLVDSESSLRASLARLSPTPDAGAGATP
jgi:Cu(I)/Ag(I) efflux system membrane fusion protein